MNTMNDSESTDATNENLSEYEPPKTAGSSLASVHGWYRMKRDSRREGHNQSPTNDHEK